MNRSRIPGGAIPPEGRGRSRDQGSEFMGLLTGRKKTRRGCNFFGMRCGLGHVNEGVRAGWGVFRISVFLVE